MYPILFHFGLFEVSAFGVCMAMGFLVASFVIWRTARDAGLEEAKILDQIVVVSLAALIGARIFFVLSHWSAFAGQVLRILAIWRFPGLSYPGALITGTIVFVLSTLQKKLPVKIMVDAYG